MSLKINITNIEHIGWAKRLIITFYINQSCFDPSIGSWEYITDGCGYKNVCGSEWITMLPNTQHPLHSSIVKYPGEYRFVWDYGGVFGLSPLDFDSEHSYLIQIALVDNSCNYLDPCANTTYVTQYGQEPVGTIDTLGDISNTSNNCGPGYALRADTNGCLFCEIQSQSGNNTPTVDTDSLVFTAIPVSRPFDIPPSNQSSFGIPWVLIEDTDAYYNEGIPLAPNNEEGSDTPPALIVSPGPQAPGPQVDQISANRNIHGTRISPFPNSYDYYGGQQQASIDQYGPGANISGSLRGHTFGGGSPKINLNNTMNAKVPLIGAEFISDSNASINARRSADQLNLNPHDLFTNSASSPVNKDSASTKVTDAISSQGTNTFIRAANNDQSKVFIKTNNSRLNQITSNEISNLPSKNKRDANERRSTTVNSTADNQNSSLANLSSTSREIGRQQNADLNLVDFSKNDPGFLSNFNLDIYIPSSIRLGDGIFCDINLTPKHNISYNYAIRVLLKSEDTVYELASTTYKLRSGPIRIARKFRVKTKPGNSFIVVQVIDENGSVKFSKNSDVYILDASTNSIGLFNTPALVDAKTSIEQLISPMDTIDALIGSPNNYNEYILEPVDGDSPNISIAVLVTSSDPNTQHAVSIYNDKIIYTNTGKLNINGISPQGIYSGAIYIILPRASISTLRLRVSNTSDRTTNVNIGLGPDIRFKPITITGYSYDYTTSTYSLIVDSSMLYSTYLTLFSSGGENIVPSTQTGNISVVSSSLGYFSGSVSTQDHGWIGIAYSYPSSADLSKRVITYVRASELYQ